MQLPAGSAGAGQRAATLARAVEVFRALHLRLGTRKTYSAHQRKFVAFAESIGVDPYLPITEHVLCMAAVDFCRTCKCTSLPQYVAALQKFHTNLGHGQLPRGEQYKQTCKGLHNFFGQVDRVEPKHALTLTDLEGILHQLDLRKFEDTCFWATLTTAFFGLLRISEYSDGALRDSDVRVVDQGVILTIPFSKTSLLPVEVRLAKRPDLLCPQKAIRLYLSMRGKQDSKTPFFVRERGAESKSGPKPLSKMQFIYKLKHHVGKLGLDPSKYSGHSCRRGGCTALFLAGVSETFIAAHGRWRSLEYRKYLDFVDDTQWRPTQQLALKGTSLPSSAKAAQLIVLPGTRPSVGRR